MKSDTPETDFEESIDNGETTPLLEFARKLERERNTLADGLIEWSDLSDAGLRLRCGELTASEIRTVRAVLKAIMQTKSTFAADSSAHTSRVTDAKTVTAGKSGNVRSISK